MKGKRENFLEFVPKKTEKIEWNLDDSGIVHLIINRNSLIDRMVRKFFSTPDKTTIDLDEIGSCVWLSIDGNKSIYEISQIVKERFGDKAEPLYQRLIEYIKILKNNNFIKIDRLR